MVKKIRSQIFFAACLILAIPNCANALPRFPFGLNPSDFQNYMNNKRNWNDGSSARFEKLSSCQLEYGFQFSDAYLAYPYMCKSGYVTISNPIGTRICSLKYAYWSASGGSGYIIRHKENKEEECRPQNWWEKKWF